MLRIFKFRLLLAMLLASAWLTSALVAAQDAASFDDPDQTPLGDVARNLRKKNPAPQQVIDNDNLDQVMNQAQSRHTSVLQFLMSGDDKNFRVVAPDVTCSLSFTAATTKALLSDQYAQMDLPPSEIFKLSGPAIVEGDALSISLFNGTGWHVSEIDVAFTVVKKNAPGIADAPGSTPPAQAFSAPSFQMAPSNFELDSVRPEKKADHTVIYKMRAAAPPLSPATFSAPLSVDLAPGQEWHWSIVQAKGYPPQNRLAVSDRPASSEAQIVSPVPNLPPDEKTQGNPSPVVLTERQ